MPVNIKSEDDVDWAAPCAAGTAQQQMSADEDDDNDSDIDDPIVREVDVYLSPALADQIYLLQYPLQHQQNPAAQQQQQQNLLNRLPTAARIKPRHAQMELEYPIVAGAGAATAAGSSGGASAYRQGAFPYMTRRVFQSQTIPVETHMCLGQLKVDNNDSTKSSLHLVPLQHISQMRPSFRHVEEDAAGGDNHANAADGGGQQDNHMDDVDHDHDSIVNSSMEAEKKPIVFQRKESERAAMIRKSSYAYKKASHDAEEWQELIVCDPHHSPQFTFNLTKIVLLSNNKNQQQAILARSDDDDTNMPNSTVVGMNYIQSLNYVKVSSTAPADMMMFASSSASSGTAAAATASSASVSGSNEVKSIIARMTVLLGNGGPIPYSILRDQFVTSSALSSATAGGVTAAATGGTADDAKLFHALSICAVLVRGNFCLHSKFLSLSKSMQRARTFLLLLFHKYQTVQKSRLCQLDWQLLLDESDSNTNNTSSNSSSAQQQQQVVTLDKLHVLLQQVGKRTNAVVNAVDRNHEATAAGWVLRVEDNLTFVAAHPEEAAQHLTYWNRLSTSSPRIKQLLEQYKNAT
jgi:DNA-directed RNA polymerase III subunit RPC5